MPKSICQQGYERERERVALADRPDPNDPGYRLATEAELRLAHTCTGCGGFATASRLCGACWAASVNLRENSK